MRHFKLTTNTKVNFLGVTLYQIELIIDCKWGKVGDKGGWVEKEENIEVRRIMIDIMGSDQYLLKSNFEVIDTDYDQFGQQRRLLRKIFF